MDISEDCWEHVGLLQEVSPSEPAPPPLQPDFLIQQQETTLGILSSFEEAAPPYPDTNLDVPKCPMNCSEDLFEKAEIETETEIEVEIEIEWEQR
ncbi:hypothetical protein HZH66_013616 [Vespula vulgaris]|uniref:Uncharacterized protein n=1 Tax=Vespula vulgaris TaxID=7454 RepID=A0A834J846_VESVU|nr:hypothetical protein HZH66_013616 [Vespula vulgaris]